MPDRPNAARTRPAVDPDRADRADRAKMISVRLTMDEFEALSAEATELGIGASTLARTLIRRGLAHQPPPTPSATPSRPAPAKPAAPSALESQLEAYLRAALRPDLQPDLVARVEALERWVAEH